MNWLIPILAALIAGPLSILVSDRIKRRNDRKTLQAGAVHEDRVDDRDDFGEITEQQRRFNRLLLDEIKRKDDECGRRIDRELALIRKEHKLEMDDALKRIVWLEGQLPVEHA